MSENSSVRDIIGRLVASTLPCDGCDEAQRSIDDTLCAECRAEIDREFADLPGAESVAVELEAAS